jgi:hypothetical protein
MTVKGLEDRKQHECNRHPDGSLGKHIVQLDTPSLPGKRQAESD